MYLTLTDIVLLTSIIQSLALAVFLLLPSNSGLISNRLLVATLVFFAAGWERSSSMAAGLRSSTQTSPTSEHSSDFYKPARSIYMRNR